LRNDYRQFRTDRIQSIRLREEGFTREHGTLEEHRKREQPVKKTRIRIQVDREVARYISNSKNYFGFVSQEEKGDQLEMTFMTDELNEGFPRWFLMFGDRATIIEPEAL